MLHVANRIVGIGRAPELGHVAGKSTRQLQFIPITERDVGPQVKELGLAAVWRIGPSAAVEAVLESIILERTRGEAKIGLTNTAAPAQDLVADAVVAVIGRHHPALGECRVHGDDVDDPHEGVGAV
ncbi:hypothetical protein SDC9_207982 [bioreactor metagenome]|uniref:Uncharacterized protein n=1 Tax=bioreactor metagenome TaxID=1076179 RepID=A0A645JA06_9ZZZZ